MTFFEETEMIREIVTKLTNHHEADSRKLWKVTDAPSSYIDVELRAIVGFEMPIRAIEGKWKLSQNRPEADRNSVITHLKDRSKPQGMEVSREMDDRRR